jgi:quinol-cytochrome oxidoreductase complex cytochrome b subunit
MYTPATGRAKPVEEEVITEENVFERPDETMGFFPTQVLNDLVVSTLILLSCVVLSYFAPAPLTDPADTATVTYIPRPEWFFFFYEQMLMFFPGYALIGFGGVVVPTIFIILLFAVPWLDPGPNYTPLKRPFATTIGFLVLVTIVLNMLLALSRVVNFPGGG